MPALSAFDAAASRALAFLGTYAGSFTAAAIFAGACLSADAPLITVGVGRTGRTFLTASVIAADAGARTAKVPETGFTAGTRHTNALSKAIGILLAGVWFVATPITATDLTGGAGACGTGLFTHPTITNSARITVII